jgi:hypothetical protein
MLTMLGLWTLWTAVSRSDWIDREAIARATAIGQSPDGAAWQFVATDSCFRTVQINGR